MEKAITKTLCLVFILTSIGVFSQNRTSINGQVLYHGNSAMANVTASLYNLNGDLIETNTTNSAGNYNFPNVADEDYIISFSTSQPAGGINLIDPFMVMLHLLNMFPFTTPIQHLASDVDGNGNVSWNDYSMILNGYLNQGQPFPVGDWVFESVYVTAGARSGITSNSTASGDVNGTYLPTKTGESVLEMKFVEQLTYSDANELIFELYAEDAIDIAGMHLIFRVPSEITIIDIESGLKNACHSLHGRELRVTWMDESHEGVSADSKKPLLRFHAKTNSKLNQEATLALQVLPGSHLINLNGELLSGVNLTMTEITLIPPASCNVAVYPNPFFSQATISYQLPQDGDVVIRIYDQGGKFVREVENASLSAGSHQAVVEGNDLLSGIYHYRFAFYGTESFTKSGSFIKSK